MFLHMMVMAFNIYIIYLMATLKMNSALREECLDKMWALRVGGEADWAVTRGQGLAQVQSHGRGIPAIINQIFEMLTLIRLDRLRIEASPKFRQLLCVIALYAAVI